MQIYDGRPSFCQWDLNQKLVVPEPGEVHFCNGTSDCSLVCKTYEEDGKILVNVPNILLQTAKAIKVYLYVENDDEQYTKDYKVFGVQARTKPDDYVYTETEIYTVEAVVDAAVDKALREAKESGEFNGKDGKDADYSLVANAIKGTKSGTEMVHLKDVSPVPHTMLLDMSNSSWMHGVVDIYGKNLFDNDPEKIKLINIPVSTTRYGYEVKLPGDTEYTLTIHPRESRDKDYLFFQIVDAAGTRKSLVKAVDGGRDSTAQYHFGGTGFYSHESGDTLYLYNGLAVKTGTLENTKDLFGRYDIQIEVGSQSTSFEPCVHSRVGFSTPDDCLHQVESISPIMNFLRPVKENGTFTVEYNRDANKVIEELITECKRLRKDVDSLLPNEDE